MKLHQAFEISRGDVVAFIGAGGKTSTLITLGYELAEMGWRVIATTTVDIQKEQLALVPRSLSPNASSAAISQALNEDRFVFLYGSIEKGIVHGPDPSWITSLIDTIDSDVILVEADQANGMALKAPYEHEPVIPPETSLVINMASLTALSETLDTKHVYNPEAIIQRYGFLEGSRIKSPWVAQILRDQELGLYNVPENTRVIAYLNRTPIRGYGRARARIIARLALQHSRLNGVAIGSTRAADPIYEVRRPIAAVVLAAGMSTRMGEPKLLLPWTEKHTIIEHIVEQLLNARAENITVVTGHMAKQVKTKVTPMGAKVTYNRAYKSGEMLSSLKIGLRSLPAHIGAVLVVLGDQPRIQPKIIYQMMMAYAEGKGDIIIPSFEMRGGHPILISQRYWPELLNLPRDATLRDLINKHREQIHYIDVDSDSVLRDVDTPQDYSDERWRAGLR